SGLAWGLPAGALAGAAALALVRRWWLFKAPQGVLREQLRAACRALFLEHAEPGAREGTFTAKGQSWRLRLVGRGRRLQVGGLPGVQGPGKAALLLEWLGKQSPGPVPRVRIVLKEG